MSLRAADFSSERCRVSVCRRQYPSFVVAHARQTAGWWRVGGVLLDGATRPSHLLIGRCGGRVVFLGVSVGGGGRGEQLGYFSNFWPQGENTQRLHTRMKLHHALSPSQLLTTVCVCVWIMDDAERGLLPQREHITPMSSARRLMHLRHQGFFNVGCYRKFCDRQRARFPFRAEKHFTPLLQQQPHFTPITQIGLPFSH